MLIAAIRLSERSFAKRFDLNGHELKIGDVCVVEDDQLAEALGEVAMFESQATIQLRHHSYPRVLRMAGESEVGWWRGLKQREIEALGMCKERARELNLDMKISSVRFDEKQKRVIFNFTAENRVDFRQLVKELAASLKSRIELWQVGVRNESGAAKGYGACGKELCCGSWIKEFRPVTIRQAKDQDMTLSPSKLSGLCGRLRCCLTYEHELYREAARESPPMGTIARFPEIGLAVVVDRNLLRRRLTVRDEKLEIHHVAFEEARDVLGKAPPSFMKGAVESTLAQLVGLSPEEAAEIARSAADNRIAAENLKKSEEPPAGALNETSPPGALQEERRPEPPRQREERRGPPPARREEWRDRRPSSGGTPEPSDQAAQSRPGDRGGSRRRGPRPERPRPPGPPRQQGPWRGQGHESQPPQREPAQRGQATSDDRGPAQAGDEAQRRRRRRRRGGRGGGGGPAGPGAPPSGGE